MLLGNDCLGLFRTVVTDPVKKLTKVGHGEVRLPLRTGEIKDP